MNILQSGITPERIAKLWGVSDTVAIYLGVLKLYTINDFIKYAAVFK